MNQQNSTLISLLILIAFLGVAAGVVWTVNRSAHEPIADLTALDPAIPIDETSQSSSRFERFDDLTLWWDDIPSDIRAASIPTSDSTNIHPNDYVGPEACRKCHKQNYTDWSEHPHRWMNAKATDDTVKGDFSGQFEMSYRGGKARFIEEDGVRQMELRRDGVTRVYDVRQTIGRRFFQYYIGRMVDGPEPESHLMRQVNHVLPFGYWLEPGEWVPVVHIVDETPDDERQDPFHVPADPDPNVDVVQYSISCSGCHTTYPLGDDLIRKAKTLSRHLPGITHWDMGKYIADSHPQFLENAAGSTEHVGIASDIVSTLHESFRKREAGSHAVSLGISCEACHLGCREHAEGRQTKPEFQPHSPLLRVASADQVEQGRTHQNVNRVCSRCHSGNRPEFANHIATWNSVEYADAMRGSCYSQLRCIDCHNPHKATGHSWTRSAEQDDQSCIRCHEQYSSPESITAHTHHTPDSEGSHCMNCHMPRINEGLQAVVRTHTIFSPNSRPMIESNHPNACNQCHTDQPIDWTLQHLKEWYGSEYDETKIATAYPQREQPVSIGWLNSNNEAVRLIGADTLTGEGQQSALPALIEALDDPFLINRQFARMGIERMLHIKLADFGYRFYMMADERRGPLEEIRSELLTKAPSQ